MKPLYIFDLDGTLALTEHRQHLVQKSQCPVCNGMAELPNGEACAACDHGWTKPNWRAFFAACIHDQPNIPVIDTLHALAESGAEIRIWSGRSAEVMAETQAWLMDHVCLPDAQLTMRLVGDHRPDEELKQIWFNELSPRDLRRLVAMFDDRAKVVRMWRAQGVPCFQVAPGDF